MVQVTKQALTNLLHFSEDAHWLAYSSSSYPNHVSANVNKKEISALKNG
jgi:hypothetical protein